MATGEQMNRDCLLPAKTLLLAGQFRSSINRSYYAAYCAVSGELVRRGAQFARGWNNPAHDQLTALIQNGLPLPAGTRRQMVVAIRRLRLTRQAADYRPGASVDRALALACLHDANLVRDALEEQVTNKDVGQLVQKHLPLVNEYVQEQFPQGFTMSVVEEGIRHEYETWYLPVLHRAQLRKMYAYYAGLPEVEGQLGENDHRKSCSSLSSPKRPTP